MERVLVTGAGGFIGHHLVTFLKERGYWVRGVDLKYPEFTDVSTDDFRILDLRRWENCLEATEDVDHVYALAADIESRSPSPLRAGYGTTGRRRKSSPP